MRAQGLDRDRPSAVDVRHLRRAFDDMGLVQVDSVSVVDRSHRLTFLSRLGPALDSARLDDWLWRSGEVVETWCHVASIIPVDEHPLVEWRQRDPGRRTYDAMAAGGRQAAAELARLREGRRQQQGLADLLAARPDLLQEVHAQVARDGPLRLDQLHDPGERTGPWWGVPPGKWALRHLFGNGMLGIADRDDRFRCAYDLIERVVPAEHRGHGLDVEEASRRHLVRATRVHGVGTAADLADVHRLDLRRSRRLLEDLADEGAVDRVEVAGWDEPAYADVDMVVPRRTSTRALVSPFDPLVWHRERAERVFDFHYRIEIYVPAAERVHGYYVLPFLLDDRLVARVDLKRHTDRGVLEVRGAFAEPGVDVPRVAGALAAELADWATQLGLGDVAVVDHGDLAAALATAVTVGPDGG